MTTRRHFVQAASTALALQSVRGAEPDPDFVKAMQAVQSAIPTAEADPQRPRYHFHPPANWTNDPNGTIFYKGWNHLFYQLNPFAARIGSQHWGHARSRDLVNWEHLPIAIWPSTEKGERFIYSGGAAIASDGRPRLIYTSIGHPQPEQWMVTPKDDDLFEWEKYPGNPVLTQAAHGDSPVNQWRDPFLFHENGRAYMVCGGSIPGGRGGAGQVQLYRAEKDDLSQWKHLGAVFHSPERDIFNIECPNLFKLDGKWVLVFSPHRPCEYYVGDLDVARVRFTPETHGVLDPGDAYASNISVDGGGRTILWLWGRTNTPPDKGWGSVITMPRVLSIGADGFLRQTPVPEFETLRGEPKSIGPASLEKPLMVNGVPGDSTEIEAEFTGSGSYGFELRRDAEGKPGIVVSIQGQYLNVGTARTYLGNTGRNKLRIFLDKRCIEVYCNDGIAAVFNWVEAADDAQGISVFGQSGGRGPRGNSGSSGRAAPTPPRLESLKVWPMKAATFNMDRFHV
jgi:beta-fructofuranosidase